MVVPEDGIILKAGLHRASFCGDNRAMSGRHFY
jgi:hypothetical protein